MHFTKSKRQNLESSHWRIWIKDVTWVNRTFTSSTHLFLHLRWRIQMLSLPRCVRDHHGTQAAIGSFNHHGSKASFGFGLLRQCKTEGECNIGMKCSQKKWMNTVHWVPFFTKKSNLLPGLNNETTNLSSSFTQRLNASNGRCKACIWQRVFCWTAS